MEVVTKNSKDIITFLKELEDLIKLITSTLSKRTPTLNGEKYLSNKDVCRLLHISIRTLQEYRDSGVVSFIQINGKILYKQSDIIKLLDDNYNPGWRN